MSCRNSIIRGTLAELPVPAGRAVCFVSLGANLAGPAGGPEHTVLKAFEALAALGDSALIVSSLWQTAPLECPEGSPPFVNAVAAFIAQSADPQELLQVLQGLETAAGRQRTAERNAARPLDLDLLLFGEQFRNTASLILPHPRMATRRFVLEPLAEIAPDMQIPGLSRTAKVLLGELPEQGGVVRMNLSPGAVVL